MAAVYDRVLKHYDVAVIGAGVFGAWTAWRLRRAGCSVLLVDAWSPGHSLSSSGGESRIIRMGYGADDIYTRMAMRSLPLWRDLAARTGQPLFHKTGVLWIARRDDPYSTATCRVLGAAGVPMETMAAGGLAARYPQMRLDDPRAYGIFEPESGALMARRAVAAVVDDAVRLGAEFAGAAVQPPTRQARQASVRTSTGEELRAGIFIFACGPWLPKLFPALLGNRIRATRQEVFFFAPPPGDGRFLPPGDGRFLPPGDGRFLSPGLPVWIEFSDPRGPYGFPALDGRGFKLAFDRHGAAIDPDTADRRISEEGVAEARRFLAERFPALGDAPLAESRVCQYESTSSGDFLIDRHPDFDNLWLAGGGSGHGFKHGPAVGEYAAARILGGKEAEPRFSLATKEETPRRAVY